MPTYIEDDADFEGDEPLFSCPYCGSEDDGCSHFLGSIDIIFGGDFCVDEGGRLTTLNGLFDELREAVAAFVAGGKERARIAALRPQRLRALVQTMADEDNVNGFTKYVRQVSRDTRLAVQLTSYEDRGCAPGFCSVVKMFWARHVPTVVVGMRQLVAQDIRRLKKYPEPAAAPARDRKARPGR